MASVEERVAAGAAWLDEAKPGWERGVDLAELEMRHDCRCVLGQLFGSHDERVARLDLAGESCDLGFTSYACASRSRAEEYAALDEAWISLLKERFDSGALSDA